VNIVYLSCHSVLEYDEIKLFTELGHNVVSYGAYSNPKNPSELRPAVKGLCYDEVLSSAVLQSSKDHLHDAVIEWADGFMVMHIDQWVRNNWDRIKHKRVVWRSIGQSIPDIELRLAPYRKEGLQVVRYSPTEQRIVNYIGQDATIRFYKDKSEFAGWTGDKAQVMTIAQSMCHPGREKELNWRVFKHGVNGLPAKLFGLGNECAGDLWGGQLSFDEMKSELRQNRCYFYTGTKPASYTLGFIEALMTGIPIVAIGSGLAYDDFYKQNTYEVADILTHNQDGFIADRIEELHDYCEQMINNHRLAKKISFSGRQTAVKYFGKKVIKQQWESFL